MRRLLPPIALVLAALAVRLAVTAATGLSAPPVKDEVSYSAYAENLAAGRGYHVDVTRTVDGREVTRRFSSLRPPLYPATLAAVYLATGPSPAAGRVLGCVLGALAAGLLLLWGRRVVPAPAAWIAAGLLAVWPSHVWVSGRLLSEPLFIALVLGFAAALQARRPLAAGVLLSLAVLTRPAGLLLLGPAAAFVLLDRERPAGVRALLLLVLPVVLLPLPWMVRNAKLHGKPLLTTNLGVTFFGGNNDVSLESRWPGRWHLPEEVLGDRAPDMGYYGWSELGEAENDRWFLDRGLAWVSGHPGRWARLLPWKAVRFFDPDQHSAKSDRATKAWVGWLSFGLLLPLLVPGVLLALGRWRETLLVWGTIAVQLALALAFYGDARVRLPAIPAMLLLGGLAIAWAVERARRSASRDASRGRPAA